MAVGFSVTGFIFFFLGVAGAVERAVIKSLAFFASAALLLAMPFLWAGPVRSDHSVIHTDSWKGVSYSRVVTINYDTYSYNWWTWNDILSGYEHNIVVAVE